MAVRRLAKNPRLDPIARAKKAEKIEERIAIWIQAFEGTECPKCGHVDLQCEWDDHGIHIHCTRPLCSWR